MLALTTGGCASPRAGAARPDASSADATVTTVEASTVEWGPLNPARGDHSPLAGRLWGDRTRSGPAGFLFHPVDGFESPPHIHNVAYRAVVIRGVIHNDDPEAAATWMPSGSFWTQVEGEAHITAARGADSLAYVEIDDGPYLVRPPAEEFAAERASMNVDASELAWSRPSPDLAYRVAPLWSAPERDAAGSMIELPAGERVTLQGRSATSRVIVIRGVVRLSASTDDDERLGPGSYFAARDGSLSISCGDEGGCVVYHRAEGEVTIGPR